MSDWQLPNRFFRNDGNNIFTDISEKSRLNDPRRSFSALPLDFNNDGLLDIYVVNDGQENQFFYNYGYDQFEEATVRVQLSNHGNGMGVDVCDFNNDGYFDIYVTNIFRYQPNAFFVNNGKGVFFDLSRQLGIDNTDWGWGIRFFDADHDMDEDVYVVNGFDSLDGEGNRNRFFRNDVDEFSNISSELGVDSNIQGMGLEVFDYDSDGDLDMLVGNREGSVDFYHNNLVETEVNVNWIQFLLQGTTSNRNAYGSVVVITCAGVDYYRYHSGVNLFGQSYKPVHFGLDNNDQIDNVQIQWSNGIKENFGKQNANHLSTLMEGEGLVDEVVLGTSSSELEKFRIYPNPFSEQLFIENNGEFQDEVYFYMSNIMGDVIYSDILKIDVLSSMFQAPIKTNQLPIGIYLYRFQSGDHSIQGKLIKW